MKTVRASGMYKDINADINDNFTELSDYGKNSNLYTALSRIPSFFKGLNIYTAYDRFVFGSFTDVHKYFDRLEGYKKFINLIHPECKCIVIQGDIMGESPTKTEALATCSLWGTFARTFETDIIPAIGNHDINAYYGNQVNLVLSKQEQRDNILNNAMLNTLSTVFKTSQCCYFYKDYISPDYKVRMIVLDQYEIPELVENNLYKYTMYQGKNYSNTQLNWLCNEALNLPSSDYHVIIVNHEGLVGNSTYNDSYECLRQIIDAFSTQGNVNMVSNVLDFEYNIDVDFSQINNFNGNFIMCLYGHIHEPSVDNITINTRQYNNIRTIATGLVYGYNKIESSGTEETASVLVVDTLERRIYILRYGNPCDCYGVGLPYGDYGISTSILY